MPLYGDDAIEQHGDAHLREFDAKSIADLLQSERFQVERIGGVALLDFPFGEKIIGRLNRIPAFRTFFTKWEELMGTSEMSAYWGKHIVVSSRG